MTTEQQTLDDIRKEIASLPTELQDEVNKCAAAYRTSLAKGGPLAMFAYALVGAESASASEPQTE